MSWSTAEHTVLPPEESLESLLALIAGAEAVSTTLTVPCGEHLVLPPEIFEVLRDVVTAMAQGQAVRIAPVHQRLTTQEAAELLGISRPTLVKLLGMARSRMNSPGAIDGVLLADVLAYRKRLSVQERKALDRMVEIAEESGMYELAATPKHTR